jgi:hypothetical protein
MADAVAAEAWNVGTGGRLISLGRSFKRLPFRHLPFRHLPFRHLPFRLARVP